MLNARTIATFTAGFTTLAALILAIDRGGLIGWGVLFIGVGLLAKIWLKASRLDLGLSVGLAAISVLAWVGILYYVISTYESGEVVELAIDTSRGAHIARLWVLDVGGDPTVYYDAEPEVAKSLLAGKPLQFTRKGVVSTRTPEAIQIDALPDTEAKGLLEVMRAKYGDRMMAADAYYLVLGRPRDRVGLVVKLIED